MAKAVKRIVLGVTGSIAAYKAPLIVRALVKKGASVRCVTTPTAEKFVAPGALAVVSGHAVSRDMHDPALWDMAHLSLASWADVILIAPATADFIARLAHGRAQGLLDALVLSALSRVTVCPAMDADMWRHVATQENIQTLRRFGYEILGPAKGELASGRTGYGRLLEPEDIVQRVLK